MAAFHFLNDAARRGGFLDGEEFARAA